MMTVIYVVVFDYFGPNPMIGTYTRKKDAERKKRELERDGFRPVDIVRYEYKFWREFWSFLKEWHQ